MKDFVVIFGPPAVGKMTVGQELAKATGLKLFYNHQTLELANCFFPFETPSFARLNARLRNEVFDAVAGSDLPGMIFTYAWAFNLASEKEYVDGVCERFSSQGARISFVEFAARLDVRLDRNREPARLAAKPSKRDVAKSEELLLQHEAKYSFNTSDEAPFYYPERYVRLENSELSPSEAAARIQRELSLPSA